MPRETFNMYGRAALNAHKRHGDGHMYDYYGE